MKEINKKVFIADDESDLENDLMKMRKVSSNNNSQLINYLFNNLLLLENNTIIIFCIIHSIFEYTVHIY
jgi:ABC-type Mn2+/Zn2+ transport system permease subunit